MTTNRRYQLADFDFDLPAGLIAQFPASERSSSRLLHVAGGKRDDLAFTALPDLLAPGDLLVLNDTRVVRSRVVGRKATGGRVELMLERVVARRDAWVQLRSSRAPRAGSCIDLPGGATATVCERDERFFLLRFDVPSTVEAYLEQHGAVPLPPYIARAPDAGDEERYQTVYARHPGAVAAPTAGLHFDQALLAALRARQVEIAYVTLHVGAGTFLPVESDDLSRHRMHSERFRVPPATAAAIDKARASGRSVVAVGTTSLRALEAAAPGGAPAAGDEAETSLFITPGFRFRVVDRLLTNFHLPRSTLLMLVSAFAGYDAIRAAYAHAIAARYRFFSYGDAMLLERDPDAGA
ncbi:MAG: tRNA preQ1(34) S-adenosylmethionine ribosyltransferase-isomerase QueA [Casimicrobiaceae bacterium]